MNTALRLTWMFIIAAAIVSFQLPIAWWWKVILFIFLLLLIIYAPLVKLFIMEIGARDIEEEDIILALRINTWQTVEEIRKSIRKNQGVNRVSMIQVMNIAYRLANEGVIEGRERIPLQPSFFGMGNIWEYHQKSTI